MKKTYICRNSYSYSAKSSRVWSGTSRISAQGENGIFEPIFTANAESDYGYMSYMINGEKSYRRDFEKNGCIVPYFCGNNTDYDDSEFEIRWLQGDSSKRLGYPQYDFRNAKKPFAPSIPLISRKRFPKQRNM